MTTGFTTGLDGLEARFPPRYLLATTHRNLTSNVLSACGGHLKTRDKTVELRSHEHQLLDEDIITLVQAAKLLPRRRGRKTHASTIYRWTKSGLRGAVLESIQVGGTRCTTIQALGRFFDRLTNVPRRRDDSWESPAQRRIANRFVDQQLDDLGF